MTKGSPDALSSLLCVGGVSLRIAGDRTADAALVSSLEPFRVEPRVADVNVQIDWVHEIEPSTGPRLFDSGGTWRLYERGADLQFDFHIPFLGDKPCKSLHIDARFRTGSLRMSGQVFSAMTHPPVAFVYPLDELLIMHRLTQERAIELHSCGIVGPDGVGNLFVGHSEAGKSTTTRLWTAREGVEVLSDDRIIVREQAGQMLMYGTPWHGEAAFASPGSAPLKRIFILEQGLGNRPYRLSPMQAVAELFARSFVPFYEPKYVDAALDFLQALTESVPVYRYVFEPNQAAVERIINFSD
jgi:hypothetical protein